MIDRDDRESARPAHSSLASVRAAFARVTRWARTALRPRQVACALLALIALDWAISGARVIREDEQGVVLRFGAVARVAPPGMCLTLPWPIERTFVVRTTEVRTMPVGYRLVDALRGIPPAAQEMEWVSGDVNVLNLTLSVKYSIRDPVRYVLRVGPVEADFLVRRCAEGCLTGLLATMTIEEILTHGKTRVQQEIRASTQDALRRLDAGIHVVGINLGEVEPPANVITAFNDVSTAKNDKARMIHDADGYAKDLLPRARAAAERIVQEAEAYRAQTVQRAYGESSRFRDLLAEARRARDITELRLYLEAMARILPRPRKVVIDDREGSQLRLLE